jgi:hypothetical protein
MLGDRAAMATVAVKKLDVAKKFYEGKLGLELTPEQQPGALSKAAWCKDPDGNILAIVGG